jgi:hypothetical protein
LPGNETGLDLRCRYFNVPFWYPGNDGLIILAPNQIVGLAVYDISVVFNYKMYESEPNTFNEGIFVSLTLANALTII